MKYSAAVFDMDGTLLDTLQDLADALNYALVYNHFPERSLEEVRFFVGNGIRKLIERGVPAGTSVSDIDTVNKDFTSFYVVHCTDKTHPYDGVTGMLKTIRSTGCRTAVVSNKDDYAVKKLSALYFPGLFDAVVGTRPGVQKKPAPDTVFEVLRQLSCLPEQCVYIGDSDIDIGTARNAGMNCISVDWGFRGKQFLEEHSATCIVSNSEELLKELE
jgi:phosphoglycolate phosphatase